jgi:hypothetical protein
MGLSIAFWRTPWCSFGRNRGRTSAARERDTSRRPRVQLAWGSSTLLPSTPASGPSGRGGIFEAVSDEFSTSMSVPLDSDGFLRRECPTCEREFKWFPTPEGEESEPAPYGGYYCPYCAIQAGPDHWFTKAQIEQATAVITEEFVEPELKRFKRETERHSSGLVDINVDISTPEPPPPLTEDDDMRRVEFACHPNEPVKVLEDWDAPVHCLFCGTRAEPGSG